MTEKAEIRQRVWALLEKRNVARFPLPVVGRIPNFEGSREAASRLEELDCWRDARAIKANPDSPQRWARQLALKGGKILYMAVPRLKKLECFLELNPKVISEAGRASTIKGAFALGRPTRPEKVGPVDLVLAGSVAVDSDGGRLGKGGGYSDIEYALGREYGFLREGTPVVSTVHPLQLVEDEIPMHVHDIPVDFAVTPKSILRAEGRYPKPPGVQWNILSREKLEQIPILGELRQGLEGM